MLCQLDAAEAELRSELSTSANALQSAINTANGLIGTNAEDIDSLATRANSADTARNTMRGELEVRALLESHRQTCTERESVCLCVCVCVCAPRGSGCQSTTSTSWRKCSSPSTGLRASSLCSGWTSTSRQPAPHTQRKTSAQRQQLALVFAHNAQRAGTCTHQKTKRATLTGSTMPTLALRICERHTNDSLAG